MDFVKSKKNFADEKLNKKTTKLTYLRLFNNYVLPIEQSKNKDLYNFNREEVIELIQSAPTNKATTKQTLFSAINTYMAWACETKRNDRENPCETIQLKNIMGINKKSLELSYKPISEIDEYCEMIYSISSYLRVKMDSIFILICVRYGIETKELTKLTHDMIEENYITIDNRLVPIDATFHKWYNRHCEVYSCMDYVFTNQLTGGDCSLSTLNSKYTHLFKKIRAKKDSLTEGDMTEHKKSNGATKDDKETLMKIAEITTDRIPLHELVRNRKIDLLLEIYKEKGFIDGNDIISVAAIFDNLNTLTPVNVLRRYFKSITGIDIKGCNSSIAKDLGL